MEFIYNISEKAPWVWILVGLAAYFILLRHLFDKLDSIEKKIEGTSIPIKTITTYLTMLFIFVGFYLSVYAIRYSPQSGGEIVNVDHVLYLVGDIIYGIIGITLGALCVLIYKMIKGRCCNKPKVANIANCTQTNSLKDELNSITNKTGTLREVYKLLGEYLPKIEGNKGDDDGKEGERKAENETDN